MVNGEKVLIVTLYLSNNTPIDDCKIFVLFHLGTFAPKCSEEYSIVAEEGLNTMPIILAGEPFACLVLLDVLLLGLLLGPEDRGSTFPRSAS
jgi:hypothetical protein